MRVYHCLLCGLILDRDVNAAINVLIRGFGERFRVEGGDLVPSVWSEHAPPGVPAVEPVGVTADVNRPDSVSSGEALADATQTKPYALANPDI